MTEAARAMLDKQAQFRNAADGPVIGGDRRCLAMEAKAKAKAKAKAAEGGA